MFAIIGSRDGKYLKISKAYNLQFYSPEWAAALLEPGEELHQVEEYRTAPENPDPKLAYIPKYNTETQEFEFDTSEIPPSPEQRITALEEENLSLTEGAVDLDYRVLMLKLGLN